VQLPEASAPKALAILAARGETAAVIGRIRPGDGGVVLEG
jgi:hypothetical protein